ncbi:hypothetical protein [Rhodococcus koreensis]
MARQGEGSWTVVEADYWYGLEPAVRQAEAAATCCAESNVGCVLTGDVAVDVYAPWRLPAVGGLYIRGLLDYTVAGFTPTTDAKYTLVVTVPQDPTVWRTAAAAQPTGRVDPIIALHEVLGSPDAAEAAEHLRRAILDGTWRGSLRSADRPTPYLPFVRPPRHDTVW